MQSPQEVVLPQLPLQLLLVVNPVGRPPLPPARGRGQSNDFDYNSGKVQYTPSEYPVKPSYSKGKGYSYYMNGTVFRTSQKKSISEVDAFFTKRDRDSDNLMFV